MKGNVRQKLIAAITFLGGIYFFLEFILPETIGGFEFGKYNDQISRGVQVVGTMAIGLGLINILMVHGIAILKARKGWYNSVALLAGLLVMFTFEGVDFMHSEKSVNSWKQVSDLKAFSEVVAKENGLLAGLLVMFAFEGVDFMHSGKSVNSWKQVSDRKAFSEVAAKELVINQEQAIARLKTAGKRLEDVVEESSSGSGFLSVRKGLSENPELTDAFRSTIGESRIALGSLIETYRSGTFEQQATAHTRFETAVRAAAEASKGLASFNYERSAVKKASSLLFNGFFAPLGAAMFSLLAFYIATAAYRTFRVRSLEAGIMMLTALFVMLGQMPHGPLYIYEELPAIRRWLLLNLSTPAFRAIFFGATIAGLAMATRMWLSLEKSPLEDDGGAV